MKVERYKMAKSESKALIEAYAKTSGKPAEEIAAEIAGIFGYSKSNIPIPTGEGEQKLSPMMQAIIEAQKAEREMGATGKGEVSPMIKMMMETVTMMPLMKMMGGMDGSAAQKPQENIMELLAKNDEKWEKRLKEITDKQKEDALQARLDKLETLIAAGANKKDEHNPVLEEIKETRKELQAEKEKRHEDALAAKDDKIADLKDYVDSSLTAIQNQPQAKDPTEAFFDMMTKMENFDNTVKRRGKALGLTDEQVDREVSSTKPAWQQMLADITGEKGLLSKYIGMQKGGITETQPEIAQPEIAQTAPVIICGNCGKSSTNGTDWCDACRIQYSNDVVAEQQRKAAEAAKRAPQKTEEEARAAGEIPPAEEQPATG